MMKSTLNYLLAILLLSLGLQASALDHKLTPVSLQLKWAHQFQFAGYYAAIEQGFYEDEGLEVKLREYSPVNTDSVVDSVVSGASDFGIGGSIILSDFVNGQPIVAITAILQQNPMVLLTKQSSNIQDLSDLIGKTVMFNNGSVDHLPLLAMLATQGITSNDFTPIEHNYNYQYLIDGSVDAVSGYLSNEPYWYESNNVPINIIKPQTYGINFYGDILFTSQQVLQQKPEIVKKFKRASLKGWEYAVTHLDEMASLIRSKYNSSLSHEKLLFEARKTIELMDYPIIKIGHMHEQRWAHISNIFQQQGLIKQEVDFNRFIYMETSRTYIYTAVGLAVIALCLLIWSIRSYISHHKLTAHINRLNKVFGTTKQGWFDLNVVTGEIIASDEYALILGYKPEDFNSNFHKWQSNIHLDDKDRVIAIYKQFLTTSGIKETEYRHKTKDGTWLWLHVVGQCVEWDKSGSATRVIGVHTDISKQKQAELELIESEQHLRLSQHYGGIGAWEYDFITNKSVCSENVSQELGYPWSPTNSSWDDVFNAIYPDDRERVADIVYQHVEKGTTFDVEYKITDTQGQMKWMRSTGKAEFDSTGKPVKLRGIVQDIHVKKIADEKLRLSARVFSDAYEGILITNAEKVIIDVNPAFTEITGYSREEIIGKNPKILRSGKQDEEFYRTMWTNINELGHWQGEVWNRKKDGSVYAELLHISALYDENNKIIQYLGIFTDITQSKKQQEKLKQLAHYDVLTQLPNRALFADRFTQAIAYSKRMKTQLAVCFLDLDGFKPVNDNFGHEVGDQLLIEVAKRIIENIREIDTVSRQGGDEFTVLINDIESKEQCKQALERIHQELSKPYLINGHQHNISASGGVTLYPEDDQDIDTLLRHADQAMYVAKNTGKNKYHIFNVEDD